MIFNRHSGIAQTPTATQTSSKSTIVAAAVQVQAARLDWDAMRVYASKLASKRYSEKITHEITGSNGGSVQTLQMPDWAAIRAALARAKDGPRKDTPALNERESE